MAVQDFSKILENEVLVRRKRPYELIESHRVFEIPLGILGTLRSETDSGKTGSLARLSCVVLVRIPEPQELIPELGLFLR
jgi:hypothetical protein